MSPKNKGNLDQSKSSAVELNDEFISTMGTLGEWIEPHLRFIVAAVVAALVLSAGVIGYRWWDGKQEAKATAIYNRALVLSRVFVDPSSLPAEPEKAEGAEGEAGAGEAGTEKEAGAEAKGAEGGADKQAAQAITPPPDEDGDGIPDFFRSSEEKAAAVLVPLTELRASYGSTNVAAEARFLHAKTLQEAGRYPEALEMYKAYLGDAATADLKRAAEEGIGYAEEAVAIAQTDAQARQAGLRKALEAFGRIQPAESGPSRDLALYHEGRILSLLGERDNARAKLQKALEIAPEGGLAYDIKQRLAVLATPQ